MLVKRTLVSLLLLPIGLAVILWGGPVYAAFIALILALAAWEYLQLMRAGGFRPAGVLLLGGVLLFAAGRAWDGFASAAWIASLIILGSMAFHLVAYEQGRDQAGSDFGVTLGGVFYIGWIGAYLISLRSLPEGAYWMLLALPSVWAADSGAYLIGSRFGRRRLSPRLSPKKTWEGYLGGILFGGAAGALLGAFLPALSGPASHITLWRGVLLGFVLSVLSTLGDLGESMFKRQVGAKDSGNLLPGHGGVFDRIDSWLWAAVVGYYVITGLFLS